MSGFHPEKLTVRLIEPAGPLWPMLGRKYTLTHSDVTGQLFLDIGLVYNYKAINPGLRDEVLAAWKGGSDGNLYLWGSAYVDAGEFKKEISSFRYSIFKKEMKTALEGIIYGDAGLYQRYPELLSAPIYIRYQSVFPEYQGIFYYGTPQDYLNAS
ncbi:staygreen family protein [Peribacillus sp. SCS-37]|uniref:staygreen family protein n=1 Tax=Paraperibacillus esterisolvens TaxID=3115296 RepID=UPI003905DEF1